MNTHTCPLFAQFRLLVIVAICLSAPNAGIAQTLKLEPSLWAKLEATDDLESQLQKVPQVDLDPDYLKKTKNDTAQAAAEILARNKDDAKNPNDAFVLKLLKDRKDLAGMPFLLGKDCELSKGQAANLVRGSIGIRGAFADTVRLPKSKMPPPPADEDHAVQSFWRHVSNNKVWKKPEYLPAMQQILLAESEAHRARLVAHISDIAGRQATEILARQAIFDLDLDVREMAIAALRNRPKDEYGATLVNGLRYPLAPIVDSAAHALVSLHMNEAIPGLVALLDETAPGNSYSEFDRHGRPRLMIREVVRVNHHRNCMLCHAPVQINRDDERRLSNLPVGPVPSADAPLPPSRSVLYYAPRSGVTLVRADITYLRQDFSVRQKVEKPGTWPEMQRFDFLVRNRELTADEAASRTNKGIAYLLESAATRHYRESIADALRRLTGKDAPANSKAWREVLEFPN